MSRPDRYAVGDTDGHRGARAPRAHAAASRSAPRAPSPTGRAAVTPGQWDAPDTPGAWDAPAAPGLPDAGERIGQYELIRELGRGGMGAVFLARDTRLGRRVAIKFLQSDVPELTARFILEARATARCHHENIIVIHDVGEHRGNPYMVLEFLEGAPFTKLLEGGRTLPPARAVELVVPVVRALVRAHEHGIVHRDLKPDNLFLTDSGTVKVLDFGIAKLMQEQAGSDAGTPITPAMLAQMDAADSDSATPALTHRGALIGTIPFMSPEQWMGEGVDHRTDLWAVGILLFRMVAGRHPLHPLRGQQLMVTAILDEPMPRVRSIYPQIPDELAAVIDQCLVKPNDQRISSARALLDALEPLLPGRFSRSLRADECPYAGLSSFQEADAGRFFGRTREIAAAVARLRDQPLLGIVGPSGAGKSSFVRAGLVPALKQSGEAWTSLVLRPGRQPVAALAHLVAPMLAQESTMASTATVAADLAEHRAVVERLYAEPGYLGAVLRSRARHGQQNIVLFVDQFEELYTLVDDARERLAFTACLASVADDATAPLRVVISIRSDFLDRVPEDARFMAELSRGLHFLLPPDRAGLRDALLQPAEMAGYAFESPAMVEHMLDHLEHTPGALPLLQFAATKLWDLRDTSRRLLTEIGYQQIGGITGALASHADAVLAELPPQAQALARSLLLRLVTPERTRAIVSLDELGELGELPGQRGELERLVDHLVHARLLVVQTGGGAAGAAGAVDGVRGSVEMVHESLIHGWPLLARWLDENQDDALFLEQLRNAARQWDARGRPSGLLWRGEAMEEAQRWHRRFRGELPAVQQAYLQAVFALAARSARTRRVALAGVIGVLSLLVAAAAVALVLIRDAEREATAQAREAERQLVRTRAAEAEARTERERAVAASAEVARTNEELARKNEALVAAVQAAEQARTEAEAARARAEASKRKARKDRQRAEDKEGEARDAEAKAREANARLQDLLAQERKRIQQLEQQGATHAIGDIQLD